MIRNENSIGLDVILDTVASNNIINIFSILPCFCVSYSDVSHVLTYQNPPPKKKKKYFFIASVFLYSPSECLSKNSYILKTPTNRTTLSGTHFKNDVPSYRYASEVSKAFLAVFHTHDPFCATLFDHFSLQRASVMRCAKINYNVKFLILLVSNHTIWWPIIVHNDTCSSTD